MLATHGPKSKSAPTRKQDLIDATIGAIADHGLSNLTLSKIADRVGLTAGAINFHFDSKQALLLETLQYVSQEFALACEAALTHIDAADPVVALKALVDVSLHPVLTERRRLAVWYAFVSESKARDDYNRICGKRDEQYLRMVKGLFEQLAAEAPEDRSVDAGAMAVGFCGMLETVCLDVLFSGEEFDYKTAKRQFHAYLASVFPWRFDMPGSPRRSATKATGETVAALAPINEQGLSYTLPAWLYSSEEFAALEKRDIFLPSWQIVCHVCELPEPGDYVSFEMLDERAFVIRGEDGQIRAFYNVCRHRAHAVVQSGSGHCDGVIQCPYHGWRHALDGRNRGISAPDSFNGLDRSGFGLKTLDSEVYQGFVFIRFEKGGPSVAERFAPFASELARHDFASMTRTYDPGEGDGYWDEIIEIDWKNGVENHLEDYHFPTGHRGLFSLMERQYDRDYAGTGVARLSHVMRDEALNNWSAQRYRPLVRDHADLPMSMQKRWTYYALFPNNFFDVLLDKMNFLQMIPVGVGKMMLRGRCYALPDDGREARARRYLTDRINKRVQDEDNELTKSVQGGLRSGGYDVGVLSDKEILVKHFQDWVRERVPVSRLLHEPARSTVAAHNSQL